MTTTETESDRVAVLTGRRYDRIQTRVSFRRVAALAHSRVALGIDSIMSKVFCVQQDSVLHALRFHTSEPRLKEADNPKELQ